MEQVYINIFYGIHIGYQMNVVVSIEIYNIHKTILMIMVIISHNSLFRIFFGETAVYYGLTRTSIIIINYIIRIDIDVVNVTLSRLHRRLMHIYA